MVDSPKWFKIKADAYNKPKTLPEVCQSTLSSSLLITNRINNLFKVLKPGHWSQFPDFAK